MTVENLVTSVTRIVSSVKGARAFLEITVTQGLNDFGKMNSILMWWGKNVTA